MFVKCEKGQSNFNGSATEKYFIDWFNLRPYTEDPVTCEECNGPVPHCFANLTKYGEVSAVSYVCSKCKTKGYDDYVTEQKHQSYLERQNACCGLQNRKAVHQNLKPHYGDIRHALSHQVVLSKYVEDVINEVEPRGALIIGSVGTGKTFLSKILHNELINAERDTCFVKAVDLAILLRKETFGDQYKKVLADFRRVTTLFIDDYGTQKDTEWVRETIFSIMDYRYENQKQTILTTNCRIEKLEEREPRLASRLQDNSWMKQITLLASDMRYNNFSYQFK